MTQIKLIAIKLSSTSATYPVRIAIFHAIYVIWNHMATQREYPCAELLLSFHFQRPLTQSNVSLHVPSNPPSNARAWHTSSRQCNATDAGVQPNITACVFCRSLRKHRRLSSFSVVVAGCIEPDMTRPRRCNSAREEFSLAIW